MAEVDTDNKVISRKNEGFPEWLDFDKLRTEGIEYLGELSGKIWTDHNVHDPGITILEMLCYSLLDLGYRTSLPAKDLFTKNPDDDSSDNNFFTPSQILGCNPLTILDYRKLLVDLAGVKNAWLKIADDITISKICNNQQYTYRSFATIHPQNCISFLNGLYNVYIDLENDLTEEKKKDTLDSVRKALMSHRNLCEDFYDITVLCKQKVGVCADIEIENSADAEKIFLEIIEKLRDFISPAPRFYKLKQLLEEKGKSIEDIFSGRPFNLSESHGFVDIEEFEKIELRKEIHLSDVYDVIFNIKGISGIRNLSLQNCEGNRCMDRLVSSWVFKIFENHVPDFSLDCSGFHFTRNGGEVRVDKAKYKDYLKFNFSNSGKTLAGSVFPDLDLPVPFGNYREDIATYYPLENDFPKVYGIAEGSLPDDVSSSRKAKSLQLKGYLLFFDHLLSGYLSQLKNMRSLFSLGRPTSGEQHTYFINKQTNWPGLEKLLRFDSEENVAGTFGNTIAFPVSKKQIENLVAEGSITDCDFEKDLGPYLFCSAAERDIAVNQLMQDVLYGNDIADVIVTKNDCWFFYLYTSSNEFAIIGRGEYKTEKLARTALESIRFSASDKKSYRSYYESNAKKFSFNIGAGITGYWSYLQKLTEDEKLYSERRNSFLDHLLARFSETFTDYALLSYSYFDDDELIGNNIKQKQKFLSSYPELSSNRGKAYDYRLNGWNNNNVSGFEKKSEAYAGIGVSMQENFCHFEVVEYEEQSEVAVAWNNYALFRSDYSFDNRSEAKEAIHVLFKELQNKKNYESSYSTLDDKYTVNVKAAGAIFGYSKQFATTDESLKAINQLHNLFLNVPADDDIYPAQYQHFITLTKKLGDTKWHRNEPIINREPAFKVSATIVADFIDKKVWINSAEELDRKDISFAVNPENENELINIKAFEQDENRVDVKNKTILYQFTVNDLQKNFFFISEQEFESKPLANDNLNSFLFLLADKKNYLIDEKNSEEIYIKVLRNTQLVATNTVECKSKDEAEKSIAAIIEYTDNQIYLLSAESRPYQWKFDVKMGLPDTPEIIFSGQKEFNTNEDAVAAAALISDPNSGFDIYLNKNNELEIKDKEHPRTITAVSKIAADADPEGFRSKAKELLELKKFVGKINLESNAKELETMVVPDRISRRGNFGYRLVKKDGYHAGYNLDGDFSDKAIREQKIKEFYKAFHTNYNFLEICYGGDNIVERKDEASGTGWYHFQIKSRLHDYAPGNELILFESVYGYASAGEAQREFTNAYVSILQIASDESNYGMLISFDEKIIHATDRNANSGYIVFIPAETMKLYGYNHQQAAKELSLLASSYPVKSLKKTDSEFAEYFLCNPDPQIKDECECCTGEKEHLVYYFVFPGQQKNTGAWISSDYFETAQEALKQFYFFLILLKYKGNYHITYNECDCNWRLYLREILAVSRDRFLNAAAAWGKEGVQKFICTSQTKNSFSTFLEERGCCYTFNVACGNTGLIHPCEYDTEEKRDQGLTRLITASRKIEENIKNGNYVLYWQKMLLGWNKASGTNRGQSLECNDLIGAVENIRAYNGSTISNFEEFKKFAYYFPVKRKRLDIPNAEVYKYFLEIKLEGFCEEDLVGSEPCGCGKEENKNESCGCCCTAWVSECCFDTCEDAIHHLRKISGCLADSKNYYPVFDCECGSFGIRFFCNCEEDQKDQRNIPIDNATGGFANDRSPSHCCNEIIAFNPQCYTNPKMDCDAVKRAKHLINAEGMHVVEHILLRPHCIDKDCNCIINPCDGITQCQFEWPLSEEDPCTKGQSYCFVPGTDPYSFIATIALPAWPERFRKKENRQIFEQLLYREVPAHIMLRILWLAPADLCRFENLYHNWSKWLAQKTVCGDHNPPCELIEFLFNHQFECFECEECIPCADTVTMPDPCASTVQREKDPNEYVNEINKLYCWPLICPKDRQFYKRQLNLAELKSTTAKEKTMVVEKKILVAESDESIEAERKIDQRFYNYREKIKEVAANSANKNAALAFSFVNTPSPDFQHYREVIDTIIANKKITLETKVLTGSQKNLLLQVVTWYYLDKMVLDDKMNDHKSDLKEVFQKMESKSLLPEYKNWNGIELVELKPEISLNDVKKLFK